MHLFREIFRKGSRAFTKDFTSFLVLASFIFVGLYQFELQASPNKIRSKRIQQFIPARNLSELKQHTFVNKKTTPYNSLEGWSLEDKIGQMLIVGYRNPRQIQNLKVGGVVLFSWNLGKNISDTRKLVSSIKSLAKKNLKVPLFISTDQEGGRVLRIRKGTTQFPDAAAVGAVKDPYLAFQVGKHMGIELASIGLNMNFAPVLDLGNSRSFLGNRVWGDHSMSSGYSAVSFMRGQKAAGILAVAKHFPGHGLASIDSHFGLPVVNKTKKELMDSDLKPFKAAIGEGAQAFMTAHVEYPKIDKGPASLSKVFLDDILRKELKFKGLVITDDLEMDGVKVDDSKYGDLAIRALEAGTDMIMLVWSQKRQVEVVTAIRGAIESGRLSEEWLNAKVRRIVRIKNESIGLEHLDTKNPYWRENLRSPESLAVANKVSTQAIKWWAGESQKLTDSFRSKVNETWRVFVPAAKWKFMWKDQRTFDKVHRYNPQYKLNSKLYKRMISRLEISLKLDKEPILIFTPPRREMNDDLFQGLKRVLGRAAMRKNRKMPVLWVHQGLQPLKIKNNPEKLSLGIVSLFSASPMSFRKIQSLLEQPKGYF